MALPWRHPPGTPQPAREVGWQLSSLTLATSAPISIFYQIVPRSAPSSGSGVFRTRLEGVFVQFVSEGFEGLPAGEFFGEAGFDFGESAAGLCESVWVREHLGVG